MSKKPNVSRIELSAIQSLARQIASDLFGKGSNRADRLEAKFKTVNGERAGGGWCEESVISLIEKHLTGEST